jgi:hypothetical protein
MEEKMKELIIPLIRPERSPITADTEPTPLEIQRWEDDGGAVPPVSARSATSAQIIGDAPRHSRAKVRGSQTSRQRNPFKLCTLSN